MNTKRQTRLLFILTMALLCFFAVFYQMLPRPTGQIDVFLAVDEEKYSLYDVSEETMVAEYAGDCAVGLLLTDDYLAKYEAFLLGHFPANADGGAMYMADIDPGTDSLAGCQYALFDMNGDGVPELHVRGGNYYYIFTCYDRELRMWNRFTSYSLPTDDGGIFYTRPGGTPPHRRYQYTTFDFWGEEQFHIVFDQYDVDYNGIYDEHDLYLYQDSAVEKAQWKAFTEPYLSSRSDRILWKQWTDDLRLCDGD